jgi:hypothetical protein
MFEALGIIYIDVIRKTSQNGKLNHRKNRMVVPILIEKIEGEEEK